MTPAGQIKNKPTKRQAWLMASRPKTLPAATAPVLVGTAAAFYDKGFSLFPALAALAGALLIQIATNFANDVFDYKKGADTAERLGPVRVTSAGLLTPKEVFTGMWVVFGLATLVGVYLVAVGGLPIVIIGLLSIASGIAYTGGPFPLGYNGLGDIFVFIFFGLVAVCGTYYVQAGTVGALAWWCAIPIGLLATAIIVVNNLRDVKTDRVVGKKTMAVRIGENGAKAEYVLLAAVSYLVAPAMCVAGVAPWWTMLAWLSLPLAYQQIKLVFTVTGRALNKALGGTGRLELVYGLCLAVGLVIARLLGS
ncbi:MAG: 1,4-dihydroxy-2-naphthoate polyprenyltransferase [Chloroflexi bacterium]|uniref:1,4-dihydroxy-2-naphthoate octaprenyltransferase n=1 Tax=Candidatus Chlorohelix allophototropha TaxID=3003348 RepID=A0A8T7M7H2_9CHLR|nr:1,4-dihydroxy-2-naphthoate polyprenyltransferase [Chloroflexota bacterium]WJW68031.1 1,4-dihydroxy-2-naphthoate polyprenyltransferase [Chloroflexota bacterium L227-S17]